MRICEDLPMPAMVEVGQQWSLWMSSRQQWLLAAVTSRADGRATLKYDSRYGVDDLRVVDEADMLTTSSLFRFVRS